MRALLGPKTWRWLRTIGMNYVLYVFLFDFTQNPLHGGLLRLVSYLPFAMMAVGRPAAAGSLGRSATLRSNDIAVVTRNPAQFERAAKTNQLSFSASAFAL